MSQSAHGQEVTALGADHGDHDDGLVGTHRGDADAHHHHGCAGHMLGHLQAHLGTAFVFSLSGADARGFHEPATAFPSPFPDRLERPPQVSDPA